jgi:peptide alpha-N-acetyltransferase
VKALNRVHNLDPENPELHLRVIDLKKSCKPAFVLQSTALISIYLVSLISQPLASPAGSLIATSVESLCPSEISLETFNSQYLQRHSTFAPAILAVANASQKLGASDEELNDTLFSVFNPEVDLTIPV